VDEVIFEEFKGTGNAELHLAAGSWVACLPGHASILRPRREELLLDPKEWNWCIACGVPERYESGGGRRIAQRQAGKSVEQWAVL